MAKKPTKYVCGAVIAVSILVADHASRQGWPLWSITIAGAVFVGAVVTYLLTAQ